MAEGTVTRVIEIDVKASANAAAHLKQVASSLGGIEKTAKDTQGSLQSFFNSVTSGAKAMVSLFVANQLLDTARAFIALSDQSKVLYERMKIVTGGSELARDAFAEVARIAREQGRELDSTARLYEKVQRQAEQLGLTTKGVSQVTEGFAASLRLSGSSTQEANAAMIQFGQALASGRFQGDEFRSIMENNSVFMFELAKAAGVTMAQLRQLSKDGKIDAEFLREALFKLSSDGTNMLERMINTAEKLPKTFEQALSAVKTSFVELLGALNETAGQSEGIFTRIAKGLANVVSETAQRLHEETIIANAVLEAQGKSIEQPETPESRRMKRENELVSRRQYIQADLNRAVERYNALMKNGLTEKMSADMKATAESIVRMRGELQGIDRVFDERNRRDNSKAGSPTTQGWKPPPSLDKKGSGSVKDILGDMLDDIEQKELEINNKADGLGEMSRKVEEAIRRYAMDSTGQPTIEAAAALMKQMRERAAIIDAATLEDTASKFINDKLQKSNEREMAEAEKAQQKEIDDYFNRLHKYINKARRTDWREELGSQMDEIDKLLADRATSQQHADELRTARLELQRKYTENLMKETLTTMSTYAAQAGEVWAKSFDTMIDDVLSFSKSTKEIVTDMVEYVLKEIARIELKRALTPAIEAGRNWVTDIFSSLFGSADGSAFSASGVRFFASGGVVSQPTGFQYSGGTGVMGEAGPEAIMPLRRGADGKLGVGATPVTVNVYNNGSNTNATVEERTDSNGNREIVVLIEDAVETSIGKGRFDKVLGNSFGISRKGR